MSAYVNDPRVRVEPVAGAWWLVAYSDTLDVAVVEGDDGVFRAFEHQPGTNGGVRQGRLLDHIPPGDFNSVVRHLIGDPR